MSESIKRDSLSSDDDGEWKESGSLQIGDEVLSASGEWQRVFSIEQQAKSEQVYNFAVADNHNYFVGNNGVLVHNRYIALDNDALIPLLEGTPASAAAVARAIGSDIPVISITVAKQFLVKGDAALLREFLQLTGGRISPAASSGTVNRLVSLGVHLKDARAIGAAIDQGMKFLTRDKSILNKVPGTAISF